MADFQNHWPLGKKEGGMRRKGVEIGLNSLTAENRKKRVKAVENRLRGRASLEDNWIIPAAQAIALLDEINSSLMVKNSAGKVDITPAEVEEIGRRIRTLPDPEELQACRQEQGKKDDDEPHPHSIATADNQY
jgi:hypothetical protein